MMIDKVKSIIIKNVGLKHKFKFNGSRNQIEEFEGIINNYYPKVFTILVNDNTIKSFSYSDIVTGALEVIDCDFWPL
jgi:uncharacterized protein Veg